MLSNCAKPSYRELHGKIEKTSHVCVVGRKTDKNFSVKSHLKIGKFEKCLTDNENSVRRKKYSF